MAQRHASPVHYDRPGATPALLSWTESQEVVSLLDAQEIVLRVRRFLCRACNRLCCIVPRGVIPCRFYSVLAIGWAPALWGVERHPAASVRRWVSPWRVVGDDACRRWAACAGGRKLCSTGGCFSSASSTPKAHHEDVLP